MGKILVTGGTGYIGSHVCAALINAGYSIVILDNLKNSKVETIGRMEWVTGKHARFYRMDVRDKEHVRQVFEDNKIDAVVHLAGNKWTEEIEQHLLELYENEIGGCVALLQLMQEYHCNRLVYASGSATLADTEADKMSFSASHPYDNVKAVAEGLLRSICYIDKGFSAVALRFPEIAGAHESGLLGESAQNANGKLFPALAQVALGKSAPHTLICTDRYAAAQEYLHVMDLAAGFVAALGFEKEYLGFFSFYLGTGNCYSTLQIADAYEAACGKPITIVTQKQLPDAAACGDAELRRAKELLGWQPMADLVQICQDSWRFAQQNPKGIR